MILSPFQMRLGSSGGGAASESAESGTTLLLNNFNGVDGSTTLTDVIGGITWTPGATVQLDTEFKKFGSASLLIPGGDLALGEGIAGTPETGNWTYEFFYRITTGDPAGCKPSLVTAGQLYSFVVLIETFFNEFQYSFYNDAGDAFITGAVSATSALDTWYHVAVVRNGTRYSIYWDGVRIFTTLSATNVRDINGAGLETYNGSSWFDGVRFSSGAIYAGASFTPPSIEYTS